MLGKCEFCKTDKATQKHHVIPRSEGGNETVRCCDDCGAQVHMLFTNRELAHMTFSELLWNQTMQKYIKWKQKHPGKHTHKASKKVKEWKKFHR